MPNDGKRFGIFQCHQERVNGERIEVNATYAVAIRLPSRPQHVLSAGAVLISCVIRPANIVAVSVGVLIWTLVFADTTKVPMSFKDCFSFKAVATNVFLAALF
jgi:hypothetical protein